MSAKVCPRKYTPKIFKISLTQVSLSVILYGKNYGKKEELRQEYLYLSMFLNTIITGYSGIG